MSRNFFNSQEAADELTARTGDQWTIGNIHQKAVSGSLPVCFFYRGHLGFFNGPPENGLIHSERHFYWVGYLRSTQVEMSLPNGRNKDRVDLLCPTNVTVAMPAQGYGPIEVLCSKKLCTTNESGHCMPRVVRACEWLFHSDDLAKLIPQSNKRNPANDLPERPWLMANPNDPPPEQPWYIPARYFARQLIIEDSTLLRKRSILADKVSTSLAKVGVFKRGGEKPFVADTVLKAFVNVRLS